MKVNAIFRKVMMLHATSLSAARTFYATSLCAIAAGAMLLTADTKNLHAQGLGINNPTPHASALLDLTSTTRGLLVPRMTTAERDLINGGTPAASLLIFNTTTNFYNYYNGTSWVALLPAPQLWNIAGNAGTVDGTNFIGTTDNVPFAIRVNNQRSGYIDNANGLAFFGYQAGLNNSGATYNSAFGRQALLSNTTGYYNSAIGYSALRFNTTGIANAALGNSTLSSNTIGNYNTASGYTALYSNVGGSGATAFGNAASVLRQ